MSQIITRLNVNYIYGWGAITECGQQTPRPSSRIRCVGAVIGILIGLNLGYWGETYEYLFLLVPLILFVVVAMYVSFYGKGNMTSYSVAGFFTGYVFLVFLTVLFTQDLEWGL